MDTIVGEEVLFVGHANRDGLDHTAVAKPGIDRLVREFKRRGHPVVYWVSEEHLNWYTEDRQPSLAIISEGQEHEILVDADRVVFAGGSFRLCVLRNVQTTLHGMIRADMRDELHFIFPVEAIWMGDTWGPGERRGYPAPMVLLGSLWENRASSDSERYDAFVVPFLDSLFTEYPVLDYPPDPPSPELGVLVDGWNVGVVTLQISLRAWRSSENSTVAPTSSVARPMSVPVVPENSRLARSEREMAKSAPLVPRRFSIAAKASSRAAASPIVQEATEITMIKPGAIEKSA